MSDLRPVIVDERNVALRKQQRIPQRAYLLMLLAKFRGLWSQGRALRARTDLRPFKRAKMLDAAEYRVLKRAVASCKIAAGMAGRAKVVLLSN